MNMSICAGLYAGLNCVHHPFPPCTALEDVEDVMMALVDTCGEKILDASHC